MVRSMRKRAHSEPSQHLVGRKVSKQSKKKSISPPSKEEEKTKDLDQDDLQNDIDELTGETWISYGPEMYSSKSALKKRVIKAFADYPDYVKKFCKEWSPESYPAHRREYVKCVLRVENHNEKYKKGELSWACGINQFSDVTEKVGCCNFETGINYDKLEGKDKRKLRKRGPSECLLE